MTLSLLSSGFSVNDAANMDLTPVIVIMSAIILIIVIIIVIGVKATNKKIKNTPSLDIYGTYQGECELRKASARVVSKMTGTHPLSPSVKVNYLTFELDNGERREFAIKDESIFRSIIEGDKGVLSYRGKAFQGFDRNV